MAAFENDAFSTAAFEDDSFDFGAGGAEAEQVTDVANVTVITSLENLTWLTQ